MLFVVKMTTTKASIILLYAYKWCIRPLIINQLELHSRFRLPFLFFYFFFQPPGIHFEKDLFWPQTWSAHNWPLLMVVSGHLQFHHVYALHETACSSFECEV